MFENRETLERTPAHAVALDCLEAGVTAAHPTTVTHRTVSRMGSTVQVGPTAFDTRTEELDLSSFDEILVLGGGKAAAAVATELESILGSRITGGVVVTDRDERTVDSSNLSSTSSATSSATSSSYSSSPSSSSSSPPSSSSSPPSSSPSSSASSSSPSSSSPPSSSPSSSASSSSPSSSPPSSSSSSDSSLASSSTPNSDSPDVDHDSTIDGISIRYASHPVPDEAGVSGAQELLDIAKSADENTLIFAVITGGGSALLPAPTAGISLSDLRDTTTQLLEAGATIHEINAVRKHLSDLKGGRLAAAAAPAKVVTLVLSDVVGNDLDVIASGPLAPDPSTYSDAQSVIDRFDLDVPASVENRLSEGTTGQITETPKPGDPAFDRVSTFILADGYTAATAAGDRAASEGYNTLLLSSRIRGEAREAARTFVAVGEEILATGDPIDPPAVVVAGGETTVTVRGDGHGGPNQEFAVAAAGELADGQDTDDSQQPSPGETVVAALDTDGFDGPTDAAGGLVDVESIPRRDAEIALANNDAYPPLADRELLLKTGKTGTNVNDLRILVVGAGDPGDF